MVPGAGERLIRGERYEHLRARGTLVHPAASWLSAPTTSLVITSPGVWATGAHEVAREIGGNDDHARIRYGRIGLSLAGRRDVSF